MSQVITIDDLETYMTGTSVDSGLGQLIVDGINAWIDNHTGRCFGETKQVTERYKWQLSVWLRHMDIVSIDAVTLGWPGQTSMTVAATNYYFDSLGCLTFYGAWPNGGGTWRLSRDYLAVTYTYGVTDVPDDLKSAALGIAGGMYNWAINGQRDVAAVSVGSYQVTYTNKRVSAGSGVDDATSSADANWSVIESYKLKRV